MDENNIGWCIEAHDLAVSKLMAFREKDRRFVRQLLIKEMIDINILCQQIEKVQENNILVERARKWVGLFKDEL